MRCSLPWLLSALTLPADLSQPGETYPILAFLSVFERAVTFSLTLLMLLITGFLLWTPISIRRNIVVHASIYSVYFLLSAAVIFLRNIKGETLAEAVSIARMSLFAVCSLLWILLLSKRGEEMVMRGPQQVATIGRNPPCTPDGRRERLPVEAIQ